MTFLDRLLKKRTPLDDVTGFNGGSLQDQLDQQGSPDRMSGVRSSQVPPQTMADQYMSQVQPMDDSRPRQVNPFQQRLLQSSTRSRVADPVNFDVSKLQDLQSQKDPRWEKILNATAAGVASAAQGGAPIRPIPTRRERDILKAQGQLGQDVAVSREQAQNKALQSQMDAREAMAAQRETANELRARGLDQQASAAEQKRIQDNRNNLVRTYNGQTDFDPDDPSNAGFVAEWTKEFGYKPAKNVRGSQMAVVQGYRPDGTPIVSIVNKGKGSASEVTGNLPATTEGQQNRAERVRIVNEQEAGKNARQQQSIGAQDRRQQVGISATNARMGDPQQMYDKASGMWAEAQQKRAEAANLKTDRRAAATKIREAEQLENQTRQLQRQGDRAKAAQGNQPQARAGAGAFDLGAWKAAHPNATEQEVQGVRSKAKARNLSIIE